MLTDRRGRAVSPLAGPSTGGAYSKPPDPRPASAGAAWRFAGWAWDARALKWRPEYRHVGYPLTVRDYAERDEVAATLNHRHWRTFRTPLEALEHFFPLGSTSGDVH